MRGCGANRRIARTKVLTHGVLSPECRTALLLRFHRRSACPVLQPPVSPPSPPTPQQLKKALIAGGFEVFRTLPEEVVLAERVRENLILDSGVRVGPLGDGKVQVRLVLRAQKGDFPNDDDSSL